MRTRTIPRDTVLDPDAFPCNGFDCADCGGWWTLGENAEAHHREMVHRTRQARLVLGPRSTPDPAYDALRLADGMAQSLSGAATDLSTLEQILDDRGGAPTAVWTAIERLRAHLERGGERIRRAQSGDYRGHGADGYDNCAKCGLPQNRWALEDCTLDTLDNSEEVC